jgi:hypothetical protein
MGSYRDAQPTEETAAAGGLKRCTWSHRHARGFEDEDKNEVPLCFAKSKEGVFAYRGLSSNWALIAHLLTHLLEAFK